MFENPIFWVALVAVVIVIAIIILAKKATASQQENFHRDVTSRTTKLQVNSAGELEDDDAADARSMTEDKMPKTIGTPIFNDDTGPTERRSPCSILSSTADVWVIGPSGPIKMKPTTIRDNEATLENAECVAKVVLKKNYFSQSVADKLGIRRETWCLDDIRRKSEQQWYRRNNGSSLSFSRQVGDSNRAWLGEYSLFADFFDITLDFMFMLMDEFYYEFDHYQDQFPIEDDMVEGLGEENFNEEPSVEDAEETAVLEMGEQINVAATEEYQAPGPAMNMEEPEPAPAPPEPEPERHYEAPPTYEAPSSYDSGGDSYDSGDSGGGDD